MTQLFPNPGENHSGSEPCPSNLSRSLVLSLLILFQGPSGAGRASCVFSRKGCFPHPAFFPPQDWAQGNTHTMWSWTGAQLGHFPTNGREGRREGREGKGVRQSRRPGRGCRAEGGREVKNGLEFIKHLLCARHFPRILDLSSQRPRRGRDYHFPFSDEKK